MRRMGARVVGIPLESDGVNVEAPGSRVAP